jgi:type II secretory pathway component PulF
MALTMNALELKWVKFQIGTTERLNLYNKIASFMEEGVDLQNIFEQLYIQYIKNNKKDPRAAMLNEWNESISAGRSLSVTMSEWVPPSEIMVIRAGEKSGNLANAFRNAVIITESSKKMIGALTSEMGYPVFLLIMLFGLIYMFSVSIVPKLVAVADPETWPDVSYALYEMANFVQNKWWIVIIGIIGTGYFISWSFTRLTGKGRYYLDKIPPWSIYRTFQSSAFLVSVSAMLKTGIPIFDAINDMKMMSKPYVRKHLEMMILKLNVGNSIGVSMNSGFLDIETGMDVEIYAELRGLDASMEKIGLNAIDNSIKTIETAAAIIKNALLVIVAAYIGWTYYAFNTLTQSIGDNLGGMM